MSIVAYTGLPGSGKSYGVVENVIIPMIKEKRKIITNISLKIGTLTDDYPGAEIIYFDRTSINPEQYFDLKTQPGAIWVIDECQHLWPAGIKMTNVSESMKSFFTEHRHSEDNNGLSTEIVLITQDLSQLAKFVRDLVEETFRAVKLSALSMNKKYRVDAYNGPACGPNPRNPVNQYYGSYKQDVYKYYKTHTHAKTNFTQAMEKKADDRGVVWKNPIVKYGFPIAILLIGFGIYQSYKYFNKDQNITDEDVIKTQSAEYKPVNNSQKYQGFERPTVKEIQLNWELELNGLEYSDKWRITGDINNKYILTSNHGTRTIDKRICTIADITGEEYCVIAGKLVTWYSSTLPGEDNSGGVITGVNNVKDGVM